MREIALGLVIDDVLERDIEALVAELHREALVGIVPKAVQEERIHRSRLLADNAGQSRAFGPVTLTRGAEAAVKVDLHAGGLGKLVRRQFGAALVEVVGDAHRPDSVRTGGSGPDLIELFNGRHDRSLRLLDDIQIR